MLLYYNDVSEVTLMYKRINIHAVDAFIACINDRFNQPGFKA